jgi:hypothetical protein
LIRLTNEDKVLRLSACGAVKGMGWDGTIILIFFAAAY